MAQVMWYFPSSSEDDDDEIDDVHPSKKLKVAAYPSQHNRIIETTSSGFKFHLELKGLKASLEPVLNPKGSGSSSTRCRDAKKILAAYGITLDPKTQKLGAKTPEDGIYIQSVEQKSRAYHDGRIRCRDVLIAMNGFHIKVVLSDSSTLKKAIRYLKTHHLWLEVHRLYDAGDEQAGPLCRSFGEKLLSNPQFADVVFEVRGTDIPSYKVIISERSPVFQAMFTHDMVEKKTNRVRITDVDPPVFRTLLRFIYSGRLEPEEKGVNHLLEVARVGDMYGVPQLSEICFDHLVSSLSPKNAVDMLIAAHDKISLDLKFRRKIFRFMAAWHDEIVSSSSWKDLQMHPSLLADFCASLSKTVQETEEYCASLASEES